MTDAHYSNAQHDPSRSEPPGTPAPPRWLTAALVAGMAFVVVGGLVAFSGYDTLIGRLPLALTAVWFALLALVLVLAIRFRRGRPLVAFGGVSLAVLAVGVLGMPMVARAALSESQLAAAAERVQAGETVERAGLYWPEFSWYDEDEQCAFFTTQGFFVSSYGVAYCRRLTCPQRGSRPADSGSSAARASSPIQGVRRTPAW